MRFYFSHALHTSSNIRLNKRSVWKSVATRVHRSDIVSQPPSWEKSTTITIASASLWPTQWSKHVSVGKCARDLASRRNNHWSVVVHLCREIVSLDFQKKWIKSQYVHHRCDYDSANEISPCTPRYRVLGLVFSFLLVNISRRTISQMIYLTLRPWFEINELLRHVFDGADAVIPVCLWWSKRRPANMILNRKKGNQSGFDGAEVIIHQQLPLPTR